MRRHVRDEEAGLPVPRSLRLAAALSWRLLLVAAVVVLVAVAVARLRLVVLPLVVALLLTSVLAAPVGALRARGWPAGLAALTVLGGSLVAAAGLAWAVVLPVAGELGNVDEGVRSGIERVGAWLVDGPLGLSEGEIDRAVDRAYEELRSHGGAIAGGVVSGTILVAEAAAGAILTVFLLFFFLKDGERIWGWIVGLFPARSRLDVDEVGRRVQRTLRGYLRGVALVGLVDAVLIGLALALIGVPLVLPLALLTFVGGFLPLVGATVAGFAAAMVALVSEGPTAALLVVVSVVAVQQLEGHLLQPVVVGRSVKLHPVAILLALAAGGAIWGLPGAFLAVPVTAALSTAAGYLRSARGAAAEGWGLDPIGAPPARRDSAGACR